MLARNYHNPNGFLTDQAALRKATSFVRRTAVVFGLYVNSQVTLKGNTFINPQAILLQLKNLVMRWKKGDRVGVGIQYIKLATQLGLVIQRESVGLASPINFEASNITDTSIDLDWEMPPAYDGVLLNFVLQRADNNLFTDAITIYNGGDTDFLDEGLDPETTYFYRVKAQRTDFFDSSWVELEVETIATP